MKRAVLRIAARQKRQKTWKRMPSLIPVVRSEGGIAERLRAGDTPQLLASEASTKASTI
jgi:hypothetical protein